MIYTKKRTTYLDGDLAPCHDYHGDFSGNFGFWNCSKSVIWKMLKSSGVNCTVATMEGLSATDTEDHVVDNAGQGPKL